VYADPIRGNVIEHVAAENTAGKTVYIGTRLTVADGQIAEVEINFDDRANVNAKNLVPADPRWSHSVDRQHRINGRRNQDIGIHTIVTNGSNQGSQRDKGVLSSELCSFVQRYLFSCA